MSHIEIILEDLTEHPKCPHGPTILFSRFINGKRTNFFACSACRDRKDCSFYLCESEKHKVSDVKKKEWEFKIRNYTKGIQHRKLFLLLNEIQQLPEIMRNYCITCQQFVYFKFKQKHEGHHIKPNLSDYDLRHPSEILLPLDNPKKEAQYLFSKVAVDTIIDIVRQQNIKNILCIGAPRLHESIESVHDDMSSLMLDIDKRYHSFFGPLQFCWYNMFNHHFFFEESKEVFIDFIRNGGKDLCIIMDPPFGGRIELLAQTINSINALNKKINNVTSNIPVLFIFPYFMEPQILNSFSDFIKLDYKIDYDNHALFREGPKGRKQGSPVRIFTNLNPNSIILPENQGYKRCRKCDRWVSVENRHCNLCNSCTSKDGRTYVHCNVCGRCVKPTWTHCGNCNRCAQKDHDCKELVFSQACFHCKELGHKKRECPKVNQEMLTLKRRKMLKGISKKQKVFNK